MRVFISHASQDKPAVQALDAALRARGIETWLDQWEIAPGDDLVAKINQGLSECDRGLVILSNHALESHWFQAEQSSLIFEMIENNQLLIPIKAEKTVIIPPLLKSKIYLNITDYDAIADALHGRKPKPPRVAKTEWGKLIPAVLRLEKHGDAGGCQVSLSIDGEARGSVTHAGIPNALQQSQLNFLNGFRLGPNRDFDTRLREKMNVNMQQLGERLRDFCLPGAMGTELAACLKDLPIGAKLQLCVEAEGTALLGLPFEAMCLPDGAVLSTHASVIMVRRPRHAKAHVFEPLAGPLKILVAVGCPDERKTRSPVLDQEQELSNIFKALDMARDDERAQVRILEVSEPKQIRAAIQRDAYHVLHLSCHGASTSVELEDEDGEPISVTAEALAHALKCTNRPMPLVLLNACHTGAPPQRGETANFAQALLNQGVPAVLAMQTAISDTYAIHLAGAFYRNLTHREQLLPSSALASARIELEEQRRDAIAKKRPLGETQPEFAVATLFLAGEERPLANFDGPTQPLTQEPVHSMSGPVLQLGLNDLVGRKPALRQALRVIRDDAASAGVVLTGTGGLGKSALAGRMMQRLGEDGWVVAAFKGNLSVDGVITALTEALRASGKDKWLARAKEFEKYEEENQRLALLEKGLNQEKWLLVLDDFEQNLTLGGQEFTNELWRDLFARWVNACHRGRLILTCRHPIPGFENLLAHRPLEPLSPAQTRKLLLRLDTLKQEPTDALNKVFALLGGHPRMWEMLDALLNRGKGRLTHVTQKLTDLKQGLDKKTRQHLEDDLSLDGAMRQTIELGVRDIFLGDLVALAQSEGLREALYHLAASNLPVTPKGLAKMLAPDLSESGDPKRARTQIKVLAGLSLVVGDPQVAVMVQRWTAEGLELLEPTYYRKCCDRAGDFRMWRAEHESHDLADGMEATRNYLKSASFEKAVNAATGCLRFMENNQLTQELAAFAGEVLELLPDNHAGLSLIGDLEGEALIKLGYSRKGLMRLQQVLEFDQLRSSLEPERADYKRDVSVSLDKVGNVLVGQGEGEKALGHYEKSLEIMHELIEKEPERADYKRDVSMSLESLGDVLVGQGEGEKALVHYEKSLEIRKALSEKEPERADYKRDVSVSYNKVGDVLVGQGEGEKALGHYEKSLEIRKALREKEPGRADYKRDVSVSYNKVGDVLVGQGEGEKALVHYEKSLEIIKELIEKEPGRADYKRDVWVSYNKVGDVLVGQGEGEKALVHYEKALEIIKELIEKEPGRADYKRDLSVSYSHLAALHESVGNMEACLAYAQKDLAIAAALAKQEPQRADLQEDLAISCFQVARLAEDQEIVGTGMQILLNLYQQGKLSHRFIPMVEAFLKQNAQTDEASGKE